MFTQLPPDRYAGVRPLFDTLAFNIEIPSVLDGNTRGRVYVDRPAAPRRALIWDELAALYLAGPPDPAFDAAMQAWVSETVIAQAQAYGIPDLTLVCDSSAWYAHLPALFPTLSLTPGLRHHYLHTHTRQALPPLAPGFTLRPVDARLLARDGMPGLDWLKGWILSFWPTLDTFLQRGVGFVVLGHADTVSADAIVSLCISVFVSETSVEFGTATQEPYRRRGFSSAAAAAGINACLDRGCEPVWHCWADNAPSVAVAGKVGFKLQRHYEVLRLWVPSRDDGTAH